MTVITQIAGGGRVGLVRSARTLSVIIRRQFQSFQSKQELCAEIRMSAGCGEGQPGGGWGDSVSSRALGWSYQWIVSFVGRNYWQAFLVTQLPLWEAQFITQMMTLGASLS